MRYEKNVRSCSDTSVAGNAQETRFHALQQCDDAYYEVDFEMDAPALDSYLFIPACVYNGNRFEAVKRRYPPMYLESEMDVTPPIRMTEVPRLPKTGDGCLEITTGDASCPCVGVFNARIGEAFLLFTNQGAMGHNNGITLRQTGERLCIELHAPAKRHLVYRWYEGYPSLRENPEADLPLRVEKGSEIVIEHQIFVFRCRDINEMYRVFFEKRADRYHGAAHASLPFSAFFKMSEEQQNAHHFDEEFGFYALSSLDGSDNSKFSHWQAGWVGGGMTSLAFLADGCELSRQRAVKTLEFAARYQSKAGWFYGIVCHGKVYHDCFGYYEDRYNLVLVRKHADLVYFMFRQILIARKTGAAMPESVIKSAVLGADALVSIFDRYGQFGQFINSETGEIVVGGSASAAIAPAALCAAYKVTGNRRYLESAEAAGEFFYQNAVCAGVTNGGPGEILAAPDSESCAALLESFTILDETEPGEKWLRYAFDAACQMASWVVPYDYAFPAESRFGKMGILSTGSVWANVQNKHSAPGMCTIAPTAYLRLYRRTGEERFLKIMSEIAHYMPQSASHPARPMTTVQGYELRPGEMCERVNLSDWEGNNNVGDAIFGSSSWPETSLLLTCVEIPGVYVFPERGIVTVSDHVNAWMTNGELVLQNPTVYPAEVRVMLETEESVKESLGFFYPERFRTVHVDSGAVVRLPLNK